MVGETSPRAAAGERDAIAVIGMGCRLPQASDPAQLWTLLREGVNAVTEAPEDRCPSSGDYRLGGFLESVDTFDAAFFSISPNEAAAMDPHQRLVLELAWEALEDARLIPGRLRGSTTGVYLGAISNDHAALLSGLGEDAGRHTYVGANRAMIANRVSYFLGLRGPSLTLDTGQSSSLVAVEMACEGLRRGEITLALAGGVNLNLSRETTELIGRFGALSPDGRCHVFDSRANGYVRGEGGGVVVLKPLRTALADGDPVHAVILGGATNNDGGGDGLTVPNAEAQQEVIRLACARAAVDPAEVGYVELHGTGTKAGDPVEAAALGATYGRDRAEPLLVGSVKTNIGHLEGAAGVAGLLKVVLSLKHGTVPPSLHFESPPPEIPLDELHLRVAQMPGEWPDGDGPPMAGVSAFGMGGTNCHLILARHDQDSPARDSIPSGNPPLVLSARDDLALCEVARRLAPIAEESANADVALSLLRSRTSFERRAVIVGAGADGLRALASGEPHDDVITGTATDGDLALVFPGQGSQWPGMARALLECSPDFAGRLAECAEALEPFIDYDLMDVLRERPGAPGLERVDVVQPALWAMMVSLARVWRGFGVEPGAVVGHSQGEIAAATVIGALSLEDAARVVALRSRAIAGIHGSDGVSGGMLSIAAPLATVEREIRDLPQVSLAAYNGPRTAVLSGPRDALAELADRLPEYRTKLLPVSYASHSPEVEAVRDEVLAALEPIRPVSVDTTFVSTLTGEPMDTSELGAAYWYESLRNPVRFAQAIESALHRGCALFVECSPHPVLLGGLEEIVEEAGRDAAVAGTLRRDQGDEDRLLRAAARAYVSGAPVDWSGPCDTPGATLIDLPTYPFQRRPYGLRLPARAPAARQDAASPAMSRSELGALVSSTAARILGHEDAGAIDPGRTFKDLGFDSVTSVDLRDGLGAATGLRLPAGVLFDHPTPDRLAGRLHAMVTGAAGGEAPDAIARPETDDEVAIVGMGCRYPGEVSSPDDLWRLVTGGVDAIGEFPGNRGWDLDALFAGGPDRSGTSDTRQGGFLHDADTFDAAFFGISPREALAMDPQQRLLLEVCWETLERAGVDPTGLRGSDTGVFVGAMAPDYGPRLDQPTGTTDGHLLTGTALSVTSGRIAYTLGLNGPAVTTDTACSSSLVSIILALQALRRGECSLALAGGATVMARPGMFVEFSRQGGLSADGRCKAFSAWADGTGWAEGAGMVLLERLSDARRHGHPVLAVIKGGAINQDGASNGLTAPNGPAQVDVINRALGDAGVTADAVDVVEAHGTGTKLGDSIEAESIITAYGSVRDPDRPVWLGSLKSNIGHTQAAAGVGGVIKMVKALEHRTLPPTLHVDEPTPQVDWEARGVRLLASSVELPDDGPLRAAVSSFGISGTNAHLVIESGPAAEPAPDTSGTPLVWVFSARTAWALHAQAARLRDHAADLSDDELAEAGRALSRRAGFTYRAVVVAEHRDELMGGLAAVAAGEPHSAVVSGAAPADARSVFVFPGQGAQWAGMAADLLDSSPVFRAEIERCDAALSVHTGWSVVDVLRGDENAPALEGSDVIQPVLFAVVLSLAALWRSVGVRPPTVLGHSQGEIAAACVAGAISLEDAARVVALRSRALMGLGDIGGMLAVSLPAPRVAELLEPWTGRLWLAVHSGPESCVVGGDADALDEFAASFDGSVRTRRVAIGYAAHTPHIQAIEEELLSACDGITPRPTDIAFCSSMEGRVIETERLTADYWFTSLRTPVQFQQAVESIAATGTHVFVEAAPHPVLSGHVEDTLAAAGHPGGAVGTLRRGDGGWRRFITSAGQAWVQGADVDWAAALGGPARHRDGLPTYPFERRRYWIGPEAGSGAGTGPGESRHPLLRGFVPLAADDGFLLTGRLSRTQTPWLADHVVDGEVLLPGTAFLDMALEAAARAGCDAVEDLTLEAPLFLRDPMQVQLAVAPADDHGRHQFSVYARPAADADAPWTRHAGGLLGAASAVASGVWSPEGDVVDLDDLYERLAERGYGYGPAFQGLRAAWITGDVHHVEVALPDHVRGESDRFTVHPALLDAALHLVVLESTGEPGTLLLPFSWGGVQVAGIAAGGADTLRVRIEMSDAGDDGDTSLSLAIFDAAGSPIGVAGSLALRSIPGTGNAPADSVASYGIDWTADFPGTDHGEASARRWAVVGDGAFAIPESSHHYDLADLSMGEVPALVLAPMSADDDLPFAAHDVAYQTLELIQGWLGDDRFEQSRLVFATMPGNPATATAGGLVRTAEAEHPGRFALVEMVEAAAQEASWDAIAAALDAGESQLRVDADGAVLVPRLVRRAVDGAGPALDSGTVLVTGGTKGLGALCARRLVDRHGVRELVLASRSGPDAPEATSLVAELAELGAQARVAACDVSDRNALAGLLETIPSLTGVVHAAGVLDDAVVEGLSETHLDVVLEPKADAAWHLHELTRDRSLAAFVLFSSISGLIGSTGQGNYAAANGFLDALAAYRHEMDLPAVSIAWGLWDTGMASELAESDVARWARTGIAPLGVDRGLALFDAALGGSGPVMVAAEWDRAGLKARAEEGDLAPILRGLTRATRRTAAAAAPTAQKSGGDLADRLAALGEADALAYLTGIVRAHVATVLGHDSPDRIDVDRAFTEVGFDSLTAVELRNRLSAEIGSRLPATIIFDHPTVSALAGHLFRSLAPELPSPEDALRAAVDEAESLLRAANGEADGLRGRFATILQGALVRIGADQVAGPNGAAGEIFGASDEEMFALIDNRTVRGVRRPDHDE